MTVVDHDDGTLAMTTDRSSDEQSVVTNDRIGEVISEHRDALIGRTIEELSGRMPDVYRAIPDDVLRVDVSEFVDAMLEMWTTDNPQELYQHQLRIAADRIKRGMTLAQLLNATLVGFPLMRRFAEEHGLPFEPMEQHLMRTVMLSGDAYSRAYQEHVDQLERQRSRAETEANRMRALSELVAGVAHEINTPLGIIIQASTMVSEELEHEDIPAIARDDEASEVLSDVADAVLLIEKNVGRVDSLVKSFKSLSIHQNTDVVSELDLVELCKGAVASFRSRDSASKIKVEVVDHRADPSRKWVGHGTYLVNILIGLLTNVERYAYEDARGPATIELLDREDDGLRIVVSDRGRGIPPENLEKVFNPFFTTGRSIGACGLGLTIVYNLVTQAMGGMVRIEPGDPGVRVVLDVPVVEGAASG